MTEMNPFTEIQVRKKHKELHGKKTHFWKAPKAWVNLT
jgi:hypothetical protein